MCKLMLAMNASVIPKTPGLDGPAGDAADPSVVRENMPWPDTRDGKPIGSLDRERVGSSIEEEEEEENREADAVRSRDLRRAGLSAFGFGGTNAHAVFEEYAPPRSEDELR